MLASRGRGVSEGIYCFAYVHRQLACVLHAAQEQTVLLAGESQLPGFVGEEGKVQMNERPQGLQQLLPFSSTRLLFPTDRSAASSVHQLRGVLQGGLGVLGITQTA